MLYCRPNLCRHLSDLPDPPSISSAPLRVGEPCPALCCLESSLHSESSAHIFGPQGNTFLSSPACVRVSHGSAAWTLGDKTMLMSPKKVGIVPCILRRVHFSQDQRTGRLLAEHLFVVPFPASVSKATWGVSQTLLSSVFM